MKKTSKNSKSMHKPPISSGDATEQSQPVDTPRYELRSSSGKKTEVKSKAVKKDDLQEDVEDKPYKMSSKKRANKDSGNETAKKSKAVKKADVKTPTKSNKKSSTSKNGAIASGSNASSAKEEKSMVKVDTKGSAMKESAKDQALVIYKNTGKGEANEKAHAEPTFEEMRERVVHILKEADDYDTLPLEDIIKRLGQHFGQDLLHKAAVVKDITIDVVINMEEEEEKVQVMETDITEVIKMLEVARAKCAAEALRIT